MKVSVITVVRNGGSTIEDTLMSVKAQRYHAVEHILIDGVSTDGTMDVVDRFRDSLACVISEPDDGIYNAMNKGMRLARGDVIGFLNADDMYAHSSVLNRVAEVFSDTKLHACYADLLYVDRADTRRIVRYWTSQPFRPGLFTRGWIPAHPTFFVRRSVYERYGGFDERYLIQSDFELALRLLEIHRIRSKYIPEIWVCMRLGGVTNRSLQTVVRGNIESFRACRQHRLAVTPWFFVRKFALRLPQFFRRPADLSMPR